MIQTLTRRCLIERYPSLLIPSESTLKVYDNVQSTDARDRLDRLLILEALPGKPSASRGKSNKVSFNVPLDFDRVQLECLEVRCNRGQKDMILEARIGT